MIGAVKQTSKRSKNREWALKINIKNKIYFSYLQLNFDILTFGQPRKHDRHLVI